ncbi:GNAT family N-acetyltransferase [Neobacillus piezotolerans]|uniref:GNAT family N-acetyltransferase n=1 Tax=Neobacillus piezotolerans TaxID=2259171 RepID=A0A3D8GK85_9BACI|nr:GNAT family N-acetyltransferase [Neobacillus piezotolerans]RDU34860.1 GNAT family N-acetyltransferase [Neobacillus piezotolerans]
MEIRPYRSGDETGWVRCRVLAFLDTAYYENVLREKEVYDNPSIELVAIENGQVIGLIDVEYEIKESTVCSRGTGLGGMIWHIAVHPDFRRQGIGKQLLLEAEKFARVNSLNRLEAWTRDDDWVNDWYVKNRFQKVDSYLQVYMGGKEEMRQALSSSLPDFHLVQAYGHYVGEKKEDIQGRFKRVHECSCYEKKL